MGGTSALNALLGGAGDPALAAAARADSPLPGSSLISGSSDQNTAVYGNVGPWGKLKRFYIFIEAPKSKVDSYPLPNTRPRWSFPISSLPDLPSLFSKAGLPTPFQEALMRTQNQVIEGEMVHLYPPFADLEMLTPAMREVIYPELAKYPVNEFHVDPVLILTPTVEEWYKSSKLRPELVARIKQLSYRRGECIAFSDLPLLLNDAKSDEESRLIFKTLTRTRALMVKMELSKAGTNTEELVNYWTTGLGLRRKDIEPLIDSVIEADGIERLDLVHILPALTRKLLYTYPGMEVARHGIMPDCHWTSLNFFNYEPHQYLLDSRLATSSVLENFTPVAPPIVTETSCSSWTTSEEMPSTPASIWRMRLFTQRTAETRSPHGYCPLWQMCGKFTSTAITRACRHTGTKVPRAVKPANNSLSGNRHQAASAITSISTSAPRGSLATWIVERAGLCPANSAS
jgi:hypothetical protein